MAENNINNPIDDFEKSKETLDISNTLLDNARLLYKLNKESSSELYKGFRDSSKILVESLNKVQGNYSKLLGYGVKVKEIHKEIEKIENALYKQSIRKSLLDEKVLRINKDLTEALDKHKQLKIDQLNASNLDYDTIRKKIKEQNKIIKNIDNEKKLIEATLLSANEFNDASQSELKFLKQKLVIEDSRLKKIDALNYKQSKALKDNKAYIESIKKIYGGLEKIPILGGMVNSKEASKKYEQAIKLNAIGKSGASPVAASLSGAFKGVGPLALITAGFSIMNMLKDIMISVDKTITDLSKSMSISKEEASRLRSELIGITQNIDKYTTLQEGVIILNNETIETFNKINNSLGTAVRFNNKFLSDMTVANTVLKLSDEALKGITLSTKAGETNAENTLKNILEQNIIYTLQGKSILNNYKTLESTLKTAGQLRILYKNNNAEIAQGVIQANMMGSSLEKMHNIAKGFLDFESSISSELEAQLLTGKNINLDMARYFSLTGQTNEMIGEITKNFSNLSEFSNLNRIAQEAYAKSLNMSVEEMSNMILEQETIKKLTKDNQQSIKEKYGLEAAIRLSNIKSAKEIIQVFKELNITEKDRAQFLTDQVYLNLQNQSIQDKFNKSLDKLKEAISNLVDGGTLDKLVNLLTSTANYFSKGGSVLGAIFGGGEAEYSKLIKKQVIDKINSDPEFKKRAEKEGVFENMWGGGTKYDEDKAIKLLYNSPKEDFVLKNNTVTPFRKDDIIVGGTGIFNNNNNEELKELNKNIKILTEYVKQGSNVYMDSYPVGTVVSLGNLKVQ